MGIDFGIKRTGVSVTDPNQIIVQGLETQDTEKLMPFLKKYALGEQIDMFIVGYPFLEGAWGNKEFKVKLDKFIEQLKKEFPATPVKLQDERNTSATAREIIRQSGKKRSQREDKRLLDQTSAVVILQEYLGHI